MKRTSLLLFVIFILIKLSSGQGVNCSGADLFCPPSSPPASINAGSAETGPNYGCLYSEPNPAWYYVQVGVSGAINIQLSSTPAHDIDFICWGPFTSPTAPCTSQLTAANTTACSYSASSTETCNIPNAIAGQIYILLVTNYSNLACNINFTQTNTGSSGAGSINCCALNISSPNANQICTGVPLNYNITSPVSTAVYTWSRGAQAGISNAAANNQTSNPITETLINTTAAPIVVSYMITPQADGCTSYPFIYSLTVNPRPVINAMSKTTCSGVAYTITPGNGTDGIVPSVTTYSWTAPTGSGITGGVAGAGSSITGTLTNTTNTVKIATCSVTPTSYGCAGTPFTVTITVNPTPVIPTQSTTTCSGVAFTETPVNSSPTSATIVPAGTSYTWSTPTVTGNMTGGAAGTGASITGTLINSTPTTQTATYTVTPFSSTGNCTGSPFMVIVTVNPTSAINNMTTTVCSGSLFTATPTNVTNGSVLANTTYTWLAPVGSGFTGGAAGTGASITGTLINTSNVVKTATYTITPSTTTAGMPCTGATFTLTVTINPTPSISPNPITTTICSGVTFAVQPFNTVNGIVPTGTTYSWPAPTGPGFTGGAAGVDSLAKVSGTLTNTSNTPKTATYLVTPKSPAGCIGATFTIVVTINPTPAITNMTKTICSGDPIIVTPLNIINGIVPSGTTYSWPAPTGTGYTGGAASSGTQTTINGTLTNTTNIIQYATYTVTPKSGSCTGATFTVTVTLNPVPTISAMTDSACSGEGFSVTPTNGTPTASTIVPVGTTYTWPAPIVTGTMTGGAIGTNAIDISGTLYNPTSLVQTATYTITPKSGSCPGPAFTLVVTIYPVPAITNITKTICSDVAFTVTPTNTTNGIVPIGTTYTWPAPVVTGTMTGGIAGTDATEISGTLTNPTNTTQTATYTVTPKSAAGCIGATFTVIVTINPAPVITNMTATSCSGVLFTVTPINGTNGVIPAGTTYTWPAPVVTATMTGGAAGTNSTTITGTITNPTSTAQTATYTVTPKTAAGCTGATFTVTVTINPAPSVTAMTATTCSGVQFTVTPVDATNGIIPIGTTYTWPAPPLPTGLSGGAAGTNATTISGTLNNSTYNPLNAIYTVTPKANGCSGATFTVTATINPAPAVTAMTASICSGQAFTVTPTNGSNGVIPTGTTYSWPDPVVTGTMTGGASGSGAININGTLVNTTNTSQTGVYTVTPLSSAGCTGANFTVTVTVNPAPAITNIDTVRCSGFLFTVIPANGLNGTVPTGTTYTWSLPTLPNGLTGGAIGTNATNISGTLTNSTNNPLTGIYTVTPKANGCIGSPFTVTVTVNPATTITNMHDTVCSGVPFTVTPIDSINGVVPAGTTFSWTVPTVTGNMTGGATGSNATNINGILTNSLSTTQTGIYTVSPIAVVGVGCPGSPFTVTIFVKPPPAINNMSTSVYSGYLINVIPQNGPNGIVPPGTSYTWPSPTVDLGITGELAGSGISINGTLFNPLSTPLNATYVVTPTSGAGCLGDTFTLAVLVNPALSITNMDTITCSGVPFTVNPQNGVNGIVPTGTSYSWPTPVLPSGLTGGTSGTNAINISGTLINATSAPLTATYTITPKVGAFIGNTFTVTVTVNPASSITNITASACSGSSFTVIPTDGTNGVVLSGTTYSWPTPTVTGNMTGGASGLNATEISGTLTNPTNLPQTATYTVTPTSGNCTGASFTVTVTINPMPAITAMTTNECSGVLFTSIPANTLNGIVPSGTTYTWSVPTGSGFTGGVAGTNATNISGTLTNTGIIPQIATYTVTPTANGCTGTAFTLTVTINPVSSITSMFDTICSGITFTVTPANGTNGIVLTGTTYTWPFPIGAGLQGLQASNGPQLNIHGTLINTTNSAHTATYIVTPTSGGCAGDTFIVKVTVKPAYNIVNSPSICQGNSVIVNGHVYNTSGAYTDHMTTVLGCDSTITTILTVNPNYNIQKDTSICEGDTVKVGPHAYTASGTYTDHLTTATGCDSTIITILTVHSNPTITITATPDTICTGDTATLLALGGSTYLWSNNETSNPIIVHPIVTTLYSVTGTNTFGCKDDEEITIVVYPKPLINPSSDITDGCEPKTINFNASAGALTYLWHFGDGDSSNIMSPAHTFNTAGTYPVTLTAVALGCKLTFNLTDITIYSQPHAAFTWIPPTIGTLGVPVSFTDETTPIFGYTYTWTFGDGSPKDYSKDPSYAYLNIGTFNVQMIVVGDHGCSDTATHSIQIIADSLTFPNVITPNGDDKNDKFYIKGLQAGAYPENTLIIYNRWGKKVYEKSNYQNDFDGEGLPNGVYYYVFTAKGILKNVQHQSSLEILR